MSRPRLPDSVAKMTGAIEKNAGRFKGRSTPKVKRLGPAPKAFTEDQVELWNEFDADFPWLGRSDRGIVGLATLLQSQINEDPKAAPLAAFAQMRMLLSSMGGTPVDRTKVSAPDDESDDPADEFLN